MKWDCQKKIRKSINTTRNRRARLETLDEGERLFKFDPKYDRAWQIVTATLDATTHWLRAYDEEFLYNG